jgi:DNA-directed RNA polymerase specialized sigma24 family protein
MKYEYTTVTGPIAIEVDERYCDMLDTLDEDEKNNNRKHSRRHPISLEQAGYEGEWFQDKADPIGDAEAAIDNERALASLTELQRTCFVENRLNGRSQREVAAGLGKSRSTIQWAVDSTIENLKKVF